MHRPEGADGRAAARGGLDRLQKLVETIGVVERANHRFERAFVDAGVGIALQAELDDPVPRGAIRARPLAKHLRVVDFADVEVRAAGGGPRLRNAALGQQLLGCPRQDQQQRPPVGGIRIAPDE